MIPDSNPTLSILRALAPAVRSVGDLRGESHVRQLALVRWLAPDADAGYEDGGGLTAAGGGAMHLDDPRVRAAMQAVRREDFLPEPQHPHAEDDRALPIGFGQTCSQPTTVRHLLSLLEVSPGDRVLDVGSGSGWSTALLAVLVGPTGAAHGVELVEELVERSRASLAGYPMPWAAIEQARAGTLGRPEHAPYDRILVSAEADVLPQVLVDQLTERGRMVVPVAGRLSVVQRRGAKPPMVERVGAYRFVPLR